MVCFEGRFIYLKRWNVGWRNGVALTDVLGVIVGFQMLPPGKIILPSSEERKIERKGEAHAHGFMRPGN